MVLNSLSLLLFKSPEGRICWASLTGSFYLVFLATEKFLSYKNRREACWLDVVLERIWHQPHLALCSVCLIFFWNFTQSIKRCSVKLACTGIWANCKVVAGTQISSSWKYILDSHRDSLINDSWNLDFSTGKMEFELSWSQRWSAITVVQCCNGWERSWWKSQRIPGIREPV